MTRREHLENKLAKRQEWAEKAENRSRSEWEKSAKAVEGISFGQPILVGHHSEKRHRAAIARAQAAGHRAIEESNLSKHHREKAAGLSGYLESTIFDDDPDAIERIQMKIENLEKQHALMLAVNKICRNKKLDEFAKISAIVDLGLTESAAKEAVHPSESWQSVGFDSYVLSNNNANIRRYKERLVSLKKRQERKAAAETAKNGVFIETLGSGFCRVTFAEKPEREIINSLKSAGFYWSGGCWRGERNKLPEAVEELAK